MVKNGQWPAEFCPKNHSFEQNFDAFYVSELHFGQNRAEKHRYDAFDSDTQTFARRCKYSDFH